MSKAGIDFQILYDRYSRETHYQQQSERYQTILSEDLKEFLEEYGCKLHEALIAFYLADFVITHSTIQDLSITDAERRDSIFKFCQIGLEYELSIEMIILLHKMTQELAKTVRRNYFYQLDRGLPINVAIIRLADTFVVPFLRFIRKLSDKIPLQWLIAVTEGAISELLANDVYQRIKAKNYLKDYSDFRLADASLSILENFVKRRTEKPNPHATVPLLAESTGAILIRNLSKNEEFFGYSETIKDKQLKKLHKEFSEVCARSKFEKGNIEPVYYRALSSSAAQRLTRQLFLVRGSASNSDYEAWFFLNTTADDLNLALNRKRLEERCRDIKGVLRRPDRSIKRLKKKKSKKEPILSEAEPKIEVKKKRKVSLWKRIFRRSKRKSVIEEPSEEVTRELTPKKPKEAVTKEKVLEIPKIEVIDEWNRNEVLNNWARTLVVDAVGGIELEEIYDTIREKDYIITGLADFPGMRDEGTLLYVQGKADELQSILTTIGPHLAELRDIAAQLLPVGAKEAQHRFIPQEVFLERKEAAMETFDLLTFAATENVLTVLMAQNTHLQNPTFIAPNRVVSKRRTLQMRTRQLASSKPGFSIENRVVAVLNSIIDTSALKSQPITAQLVSDLRPNGSRH
ncbi:MAG: hypothetical protein ACFFCQ_13115 [Promethearchaeota archaeon]